MLHVQRRLPASAQAEHDSIPAMLGFADPARLDLEEARRLGAERGRYLGTLLRELTAANPIDGE
ncbi:MAG: hypothetical protein ACREWG_13695 [Gammaproteobacteria bacterium]